MRAICSSVFEFQMSHRFCVDEDILENAPRVDADLLYMDKTDAFSKISLYAWTLH